MSLIVAWQWCCSLLFSLFLQDLLYLFLVYSLIFLFLFCFTCFPSPPLIYLYLCGTCVLHVIVWRLSESLLKPFIVQVSLQCSAYDKDLTKWPIEFCFCYNSRISLDQKELRNKKISFLMVPLQECLSEWDAVIFNCGYNMVQYNSCQLSSVLLKLWNTIYYALIVFALAGNLPSGVRSKIFKLLYIYIHHLCLFL